MANDFSIVLNSGQISKLDKTAFEKNKNTLSPENVQNLLKKPKTQIWEVPFAFLNLEDTSNEPSQNASEDNQELK